MKLQKQLSREFKGKKYPKYVVAISPRHVEELGWKEGVELEAILGDNQVLLRPKESAMIHGIDMKEERTKRRIEGRREVRE